MGSRGAARPSRGVLGRQRLRSHTPLLQPSAEQQHDDDEEDDAEPAARVIAPSAAVGPRRQGTEEGQQQNDDQDCRQHCFVPLFDWVMDSPAAMPTPSLATPCPLDDEDPTRRMRPRVRDSGAPAPACVTTARGQLVLACATRSSFLTDFTPSTRCAISDALALTEMFGTSPDRTTTPASVRTSTFFSPAWLSKLVSTGFL